MLKAERAVKIFSIQQWRGVNPVRRPGGERVGK